MLIVFSIGCFLCTLVVTYICYEPGNPSDLWVCVCISECVSENV